MTSTPSKSRKSAKATKAAKAAAAAAAAVAKSRALAKTPPPLNSWLLGLLSTMEPLPPRQWRIN
jgi:hypothetical protein